MSGSTPGNRKGPGQNDVYWRRRVFALVGAIAILTLVAWAVNGALSGAGNAQQAADTTHTGQHGHHDMPTAATSPTASPSTATPTATATPRPTASGDHGQSKHSQNKHSRGQQGQAKHGRHSGGPGPGAQAAGRAPACPGGSVVLSLFTTQYRYAPRQTPRFQLDVVSTAPRPCSFDLGGKHVQLVIKARGERQVWDSADCAGPGGRRMARLSRGVPEVLRFSWDRKVAAASCRLPGQAARPGTYTATARSGAVRSQSLIFVLGAPGVAVP